MKKTRQFYLLLLLIVQILFNGMKQKCFGQTSLISKNDSIAESLAVSGFIDVYYTYDINKPDSHIRQPFLYNHNRHNEFNLNLGVIKASYEKSRVRANLALQAGTYAEDNYSAEEGLLKHIFEANVGVSLTDDLWLDGGIFASHIGFESAISIDNPTLTRSLLAENSPYFLSGAKLTYNPGQNWTWVLLVANGWQRIARIDGNQTPAYGTQVNFHPSKNLEVNWSTFVGNDAPDSVKQMRYFNNLYLKWKATENIQLLAGYDIGIQEERDSGVNNWWSGVLIGRVLVREDFFVATRVEYYSDQSGIIVNYDAPSDFDVLGLSVNFDYLVMKNAMIRVEGRRLSSNDRLFRKSSKFTDNNYFITASMAVSF